jgi:N-acyl-D-amino-acid deacylase
MTSLPAARMGLRDRGIVRKGMFADLVLFDPETVIDRATFAQPLELPAGIKAVFVNGVKVWSEDRPTGEKPGRVLTH